jgi:heptosyltransferase-2/heptosyltransferase-3
MEWKGERPYVRVPEANKEWAAAWLQDTGFAADDELVTVDPTHKSDTRRWPPEYYARLMDLLLEKRPGLRFLLAYGPGEEAQARAVFEACVRKDRCIMPAEILSLDQLAAVQQQAVLHLGNCSAPRHLALAVGTPTFTLVGATNGKSWTYPGPDQTFACLMDLPCGRCNRDECVDGTFACLRELRPELIAPQVLEHTWPVKKPETPNSPGGPAAVHQECSGP